MAHPFQTGLAVLLLVACTPSLSAPTAMPEAVSPNIPDEKPQDLARRSSVEEAPSRSPEELRAMIEALQGEKTKLLLRFTEQHPAVVQINRRIERFRARLQALGQE